MKLIKESLLLEDDKFISKINSRKSKNGKVLVTQNEFDRLYGILIVNKYADIPMSLKQSNIVDTIITKFFSTYIIKE